MPYYLAVDGGGTKTRCLLADETTVLANAMAGGSNIVRLGEQQAREALHTVVSRVCTTAKISPAQIRAMCIGAAGAARPEIATKLRTILAEIMTGASPASIEVVSDAEIALEAAFGAGPGVIAIAGTGSIAYGRGPAGRIVRAGGWGFAISDEGSGHWIGRRAVSAVVNAHDQGCETALTARILHAWQITTLDELVQQVNSTPPPDFPRLFPVVLRAADENDAIARDLLEEAGVKLANLAAIVVRRLAPQTSVARPVAGPPAVAVLPVAMTGSVFRQSAVVRQIFYNALEQSFPGIDVRQDLTDPVQGALARAKRK
jgi:N-acetylglucosamine kinase-like BadF-type ATPase